MRKAILLLMITIPFFMSVKASAFEEPIAGVLVPLENYVPEVTSPYEQPIAGVSPAMENYYNNYEPPVVYEESVAGMSVALETYYEEKPCREYDIPLSAALQKYAYGLCMVFDNVTPEMIFAVADKESDFNPKAVGHNKNGTKDVGLMQINSSNHAWLEEKLGVTDFFDPKQNMLSGAYMLSIYGGAKELHKTLVSYNAGPDKIWELYDQGIYSTSYSREVVEIMGKLKFKKIG